MLRNRDNNGRYDFEDFQLICKCGHKLGVHAGKNDTNKRPCFNEDEQIEGANGEHCDCLNFSKK